jgi:PhnB protein
VDKLIDFVKRTFDAKETKRDSIPDGTIGHAEVRIGDSAIMIAEQKARVQTNATWDSLVC